MASPTQRSQLACVKSARSCHGQLKFRYAHMQPPATTKKDPGSSSSSSYFGFSPPRVPYGKCHRSLLSDRHIQSYVRLFKISDRYENLQKREGKESAAAALHTVQCYLTIEVVVGYVKFYSLRGSCLTKLPFMSGTLRPASPRSHDVFKQLQIDPWWQSDVICCPFSSGRGQEDQWPASLEAN